MALSGLTALESEMLDALMTSHERHALPVGFLDQQPEITSRSRQQLADWMIEVCFFKPQRGHCAEPKHQHHHCDPTRAPSCTKHLFMLHFVYSHEMVPRKCFMYHEVCSWAVH